MSRRRWLAGMGTLLLILTATVGCKVTDFSFLGFFDPAPLGEDDRVMVGSVEVVAAAIKVKLEGLGIDTRLTHEDQIVRITGTTRLGQMFVVVLDRYKSKDGTEATQVHFQWEGSADPQFKSQIKGHFTTQTPAKPG